MEDFEKMHVILFIQPGKNPETRTYSDYESIRECMAGICDTYEAYLKRQNPHAPSITYDVSDLFAFVDALFFIFCAVSRFRGDSVTYEPYSKEWIKERLLLMMRRQASTPSWVL